MSSSSSSGHGRRSAPRAYDPTMKARDAEMFDDSAVTSRAAHAAPRRAFADHVRDTPAAPIPIPVQALLWAIALVVALLMVLSVLRMTQPRAKNRPAAASVFASVAGSLTAC